MENDELSEILSPQTGISVPLTEIPDEVFSEKILGDGIGIIPSEDEIFSPVDGKIAQIAQTGHAFCMTSNDGIDIMIHIGVDTVSLKGKGFKCFVKVGDEVKKGDKLAVADLDLIRKNSLPTHTAIIITNMGNIENIEQIYGEVKAAQNVIINYKKKVV